MWHLFFSKKEKGEESLKIIFLKEYFNSADQKKTILKAARDSAQDQRDLMERYREVLKKEEQTTA